MSKNENGFADITDSIERLTREAEKNQLPKIITVEGREYLTGSLLLPPAEPRAPTAALSTLTGLVAFYLAALPAPEEGELRILHVENSRTVTLSSQPKGRHQLRDVYASARFFPPKLDGFEISRWMSVETAIIGLQSLFGPTPDLVTALRTIGNIALELQPLRTFPEIEQPSSRFILRLRAGERGPDVALFPGDGGDWELKAIGGITAFLREALPKAVIVS